MPLHTRVKGEVLDGRYLSVNPLYAREGERIEIAKHSLPESPMSPEMAYEIIHDELILGGKARLNFATFVTKWMDPRSERLMAEGSEKNMIDEDKYPQTAKLEMRCDLADLFLRRCWQTAESA